MEDYIINVTEIEEFQTIKNMDELNTIFSRAKRIINGGGTAVLVRKHSDGRSEKFDEITSLADLEKYKDWVYKYL